MPIEYTYDRARNVVNVSPHGELTIHGINSYFDEVIKDDSIEKSFVEVVCFDNITSFPFTANDANFAIAGLDELRSSKDPLGTIIIGKQAHQFGIARMIQTVYNLRRPEYKLVVVRNDDELGKALKEFDLLRQALD